MPKLSQHLSVDVGDRYVVERELGAGGWATVYLAEDVKHHRKVAMKVLHREVAASLGVERFLREIKIAATLSHPHILAVYDSGQMDGVPYYVMPYMEGESLRKRIERDVQLPIEDVLHIARQIASALGYSHGHDVIHRDINPANILLQEDHVVVADFGIAMALQIAGGERLTESGVTVGTPQYMSPEQAAGESKIDRRTDIYSLGAVTYEMLVGEPPHTGPTVQSILARVVSQPPAPIRVLRPAVPETVDRAVLKALAKTPVDRFDSAAAFAAALTDPTLTMPVSQPVTPVRPRARWTALAVAGWILFLLVGAWGVKREVPPQPVIRYVMAFADEEEPEVQFGTSLALSPDGSHLVYLGRGAQGMQLWLRERDQLRGRSIAGTDAARQPFFAPNGEDIGYLTASRDLRVTSIAGGTSTVLVDSTFRSGAAWGRDGYVYFSWQPHQGALSRIPAVGGGAPERVSTLDTSRAEVFHAWPTVLPNGRGILVTVARGEGATELSAWEIAVIDLATGEHRHLVKGVYAKYATSGHLVYVRDDGALMAAPFDQDRLRVTGGATPVITGVPVEDGVDLALSESGRLVYVGGPRQQMEVVWVDRTGVTTPVEPGWTLTPASNGGPALSRDGTRFAVSVWKPSGDTDVWIKEFSGPFSRLTLRGASNTRPVWSADGGSVMYVSDQVSSTLDLLAKRADGSTPAQVVLDLDQEIAEGRWSRDGQWLVLRLNPPDQNILAFRPGTDSVPMPLMATEFLETAPAVSPDGKWLAYVSNETGQSEVYVRPIPDAEASKHRISIDGGREPVWAHSRQELFYKDGSRNLVAAAVTTDPVFATLDRRPLFTLPRGASYSYQRAQYDVAADDQRFLMFQAIDAAGEGGLGFLIVVENFFEELKAKVGN